MSDELVAWSRAIAGACRRTSLASVAAAEKMLGTAPEALLEGVL